MNLDNAGWNTHFQNIYDNRDKGEWHAGRVVSTGKGIWSLIGDRGEMRARVSGRFMHRAGEAGDLPVAGDWVFFTGRPDSDFAVIHDVMERKNAISRNAAGGKSRASGGAARQQVIAANIDTVFIVSGLDRDYNPRRIERYLTLVYNSGATPVVVLNKADLHPDPQHAKGEIEEIAFGVPVHTVSALGGVNADSLRHHLVPGTTTALLGSSGVGKSTLINTLSGCKIQKTASISPAVGKGVHTTTHRELILLEGGAIIMDNPGMRELQIWDDESGVASAFEDIEALAGSCRFSDCTHRSEPGCAVNLAVETGELAQERLSAWIKLRREIRYLSERKSKSADTIEKEKWKKIRLLQKEYYKNR